MSNISLKTLCEKYSQVNHRERLVEVFRDFDRVLMTSSFGTTSVILLHLLHKTHPDHPVYFIDTTYHFKETLDFVESLRKKWGLNIQFVRPESIANARTRNERTWVTDPDRCCQVNKVSPIKQLTSQHDIWISGMLGQGTQGREKLPVFKHSGDILRFYPLIDMTWQEARWYKLVHDLPDHPLESRGFGSVGCTHCTQKGEGRSGRWAGTSKTECGLHVFK